MIQQFILREILWRVGKLIAQCFLGAVVLLAGCTTAGGGLLMATNGAGRAAVPPAALAGPAAAPEPAPGDAAPVVRPPTGPSPLADALLAEAFTWVGTRYVFGGNTRAGIDCSAYMVMIYRTVGIGLPRTSQAQYDATIARGLGVPTPQPGDMAFFQNTYFDAAQWVTHVGTVTRVDHATGRVWMIHAPGARAAGDPPDMPFGRVREEQITGFLASHLVGYARVLPAAPARPNQA